MTPSLPQWSAMVRDHLHSGPMRHLDSSTRFTTDHAVRPVSWVADHRGPRRASQWAPSLDDDQQRARAVEHRARRSGTGECGWET